MVLKPDSTSADACTPRAGANDADKAWLLPTARLIAAIVLLATVVVLSSWVMGHGFLLRLAPDLPTIKFNTALGLALLAAALLAHSGGLDHWLGERTSRRIWIAGGIAGGAIGGLSAVQMLFGVALGIDELVLTDDFARALMDAHAPGRMSPATATALMLLSTASLASTQSGARPGAVWIVRTCATSAAGLGLLAGVALVLYTGGLTHIEFFATMALPTAWLIALLGAGTVLAEQGARRGAAASALTAAQRRSERRLMMLVASVLVVGVLITLAVAHRTQDRELQAARVRFERLADRLTVEVQRRLELPVYGLKSARGVYSASKSVERREFRDYVASRDLPKEFPGTLGFGFIQRVPRAGLEAFVAAERADDAPDFVVKIPWLTVHPAESPCAPIQLADDLFITKFIEPLASNRPAWGYDVGSEPISRAAIERAIRTGEPTLTGRITLLQDPAERAGFLFLLAVYRNGATVASETDRIESNVGLVYAPLVTAEIFRGVDQVAEGNLEFEVFEGEETTAQTLLFDGDGHLDGQTGPSNSGLYAGRLFQTRLGLHVGGRVWTIRMSSTPQFDAASRSSKPMLATTVGLLLSTLAASLVWTAGRSRCRAEELATAMTADLRCAAIELERTARTDRLTGLPNRLLLVDRIEQAMKRFQRNPERGYAVLFLDFDRFKLVNDTMGHDAGDQLLIHIASRLRLQLRTTDSIAPAGTGHTAARMGGDEFVVLLEDLASPNDAAMVAARLVETFAAPHPIAGQSVVSTSSIGVVIGDARYSEPSELLRDADLAMYEAKAAGKGRYVLFDSSMRERLLRRMELERSLHTAARENQLALHYQPIIRVESGLVEHVEALLRWTHPVLGSIGPDEFVPIAEESGQIVALGEWVVMQAAAQAAHWRSTMGPANAPLVGVNLSRQQLNAPGLTDRLLELIRERGAKPEQLCLEVTETAVMRDPKHAAHQLELLRAAGFKLALDDFGVGQSSLASLHTLPLHIVKLDRAFIAQAGHGRSHAAMVQAVVSLATNLGMLVIAEGVETPEQLAMLQSLECQHAQGYLFGRPVPAGDIRLTNHARRAAA